MSAAWGIYEFIVNLIEVYFMYIFLKIFFRNKLDSKFRMGLILFVQAVVIQTVNILFGIGSFVGFGICVCFYIFLYNFIFKCNLSKLVLGVLVFCALIGIFEFIGTIVITTIFHITPNLICQFTKYRIICAILIRIVFYLFILFIQKIKISHGNIRKIYIYELIIILILDLFFILIVINVYMHGNSTEENRLNISIITIAIILFTFMVIRIIKEIIKYSNKEAEWTMREREYERQICYIKNMERLNYTLRSQRHDFNNHIGCIYGLLESDKIEETKKYIKKLISNMDEINSIVNINNPIIGAIINFKLNIAKEKNINVKIHTDIPPKLNIDAVDICIILGNTIDNAIEACENIDNKIINIKIYMEKEHLIIKIANTKNKQSINYDGDVKFETTKEDNDNHGFGLKNISYIVDKYDGLLKIEDKQDIFIINIALKNDSK